MHIKVWHSLMDSLFSNSTWNNQLALPDAAVCEGAFKKAFLEAIIDDARQVEGSNPSFNVMVFAE